MRVSFDLEFKDSDEFSAFLGVIRNVLTGNDPILEQLKQSLHDKTEALNLAMENITHKSNEATVNMANQNQNMVGAAPVVDQLLAQIQATNGVLDSATVLVQGIPTLIQNAVNQALSLGASQAELQPFVELNSQLQAKTQALADAVASINNPPAPPTP